MVDRFIGTDPELFANAQELAPLRSKSSVRTALAHAITGDHKPDEAAGVSRELMLGNYWQIPTFGRRKCHTSGSMARPLNPNDPTLNGKKIKSFAVEWKRSDESPLAPFKIACCQVNTCNTDRLRCVSPENSAASTHIVADPLWKIHVLQLEM